MMQFQYWIRDDGEHYHRGNCTMIEPQYHYYPITQIKYPIKSNSPYPKYRITNIRHNGKTYRPCACIYPKRNTLFDKDGE